MSPLVYAATHALLQTRITLASYRLDKAVKKLEAAELDVRYHKNQVERLASELVSLGFRYDP